MMLRRTRGGTGGAATEVARRAAVVVGLAAALGAFAAGALAAQSVFTNPVLTDARGVADPFLLKWNGEYWLYTTGNPLRAYHSTDLVTWDAIGPVLSSSDDPDAWNQTDVWAPEVVYRNGTFYLYYSATRASDDWRVSEEARRVGVATSDSPRGPFVDSGAPVTPGWGIDGQVFRDPASGQDYLFYSYLYEPELPGAGQVVDALVTPYRTSRHPTHVTRGSEAWEDKDGDPNNGSLRYTNEAPTVVERDGRYTMFYSGGSWDLPTYALGYAWSDVVMPGGGLSGPGWTKVTPPILRANDLVQGPGHNTVVLAPNNVQWVIAYHGRAVPFRSPGDRQTFLDRLFWNRERPYLQPPTLGARSAPDRPVFADRFDDDGPLEGRWDLVSGGWEASDGQAAGSGLALPATAPVRHYVFEANVRVTERQGAAGVAAGVAAWWAGARNRVDVWLDAGAGALRTTGEVDGRPIAPVETPLDAAFRFDAYHQVLITKNGARLEVRLDGVVMQHVTVPDAAGRPGLVARGGRARFDGIALTPHFRDTFDEPTVDWEPRGGAWLVDEGALHQVAGGTDRAVALKGDPARDYELTASLRWRDEVSVASVAGVAAAVDEGGATVLAGFDRTIWPYARFHVRHLRDGVVRDSLSVGIPRGFDYEAYHTIRVVKQGAGFTFFLDGREIAAARYPIGEARAGLYTEGARAAFDDVAVTPVVVPRNLLLNGSFEAERWRAGAGVTASPWRLSGAAEVVECCAYEGTWRLLVAGSDGAARQTVEGLEPGSYRLLAWTIARDGEASIHVEPAGGTPQVGPAAGGSWERVEIDFEVPSGGADVTVSIGGRVTGDAGAYVAVDNVWLVRR